MGTLRIVDKMLEGDILQPMKNKIPLHQKITFSQKGLHLLCTKLWVVIVTFTLKYQTTSLALLQSLQEPILLYTTQGEREGIKNTHKVDLFLVE